MAQVSKRLFAKAIRAVDTIRRRHEGELANDLDGGISFLVKVGQTVGWELKYTPTKFTVRQVLRAFGQKVTPETCKALVRAIYALQTRFFSDKEESAETGEKARRKRWLAKKRRAGKKRAPALMRWVGAYGGGIPYDWDAVIDYESWLPGKCLGVSFDPERPIGSGKFAIVYRFAVGWYYSGDAWTVTRKTKRGRPRRQIKRGAIPPREALRRECPEMYNEVVAANAIPVYIFCPGEDYLPLAQKMSERFGLPLLREYKRVRFTLKEAYKPKKG